MDTALSGIAFKSKSDQVDRLVLVKLRKSSSYFSLLTSCARKEKNKRTYVVTHKGSTGGVAAEFRYLDWLIKEHSKYKK